MKRARKAPKPLPEGEVEMAAAVRVRGVPFQERTPTASNKLAPGEPSSDKARPSPGRRPRRRSASPSGRGRGAR